MFQLLFLKLRSLILQIHPVNYDKRKPIATYWNVSLSNEGEGNLQFPPFTFLKQTEHATVFEPESL
jgi:hypothetical protein